MKTIKDFVELVFLISVGAIAVLFIIKDSSKTVNTVTVTKIDTITVRDTVVDVKLKVVKEYVVDTLEYVYVTNNTDTIHVPIPITDKEYKTDEYKAIIRGYNQSLHYIETYNKTEYITRNVPYKVNPRWGVGIQTGMSYDFLVGRFKPTYLSIGLQYNLFTW